ncbi:amidohydrolase family protein [Paracoccus sp. AK26]|uniref:amidohydrolase family protein n=1 Tax=Paracoccus sp. AK26 TaxID=2589076 RepID=UPI0014285239|nr:amidohydrolase family protein [Paracoccus sp. AK26]QIR84922.1 amidohydrolase family protein [Paracoccus sp. AK26]
MSAPLLIFADTILTGFDPDGTPILLEQAALLIRDGRIADAGTADTMRRRHPEVEAMGGRGKAVIPGLINAHHHVGVTPFQMGAQDHPLELWFAERLRMRDVPPDLDTLYSAFEMVASGVTTVQHLHSRAPGDVTAVLDRANRIIGAYDRLGMRVSYSFAMRDQNRVLYDDDQVFLELLPAAMRPVAARYLAGFGLSLDEQAQVFYELRNQHSGKERIAIQIAPANLHWLSNAGLEMAARLHDATGAPMHMHLLETPYQREYAARRGQGSAVEQIQRFGLLGPDLTIGHGVWLSRDDLALCKENGVCICHNCSSNLRLKSGTADLNAFLATGLPIALGIDEAGINDDRDMLQEMRMALTLHRPSGHHSPAPTAAQVLQMATRHGAATTPFRERIGGLAKGQAADLVVLDWDRVTYPWQDSRNGFADVLVRRAKAEAVAQVMVAGRTVYADGTFVNVDRKAELDRLKKWQSRPRTALDEEMAELADAAIDVVHDYYKNWR